MLKKSILLYREIFIAWYFFIFGLFLSTHSSMMICEPIAGEQTKIITHRFQFSFPALQSHYPTPLLCAIVPLPYQSHLFYTIHHHNVRTLLPKVLLCYIQSLSRYKFSPSYRNPVQTIPSHRCRDRWGSSVQL